MSGFTPLNPRPMLQQLIAQPVLLKLKWGTEYRGRLVSVDSYMNVQLAETEEYVDGRYSGTLGLVLIRCNNVLWITGAREGDKSVLGLKRENGVGSAGPDVKMEG